MINELKRLQDIALRTISSIKERQFFVRGLDAIIRKYEEPSEAMVEAGADAIGARLSMANPESRKLAARACFKAMMEAEDTP